MNHLHQVNQAMKKKGKNKFQEIEEKMIIKVKLINIHTVGDHLKDKIKIVKEEKDHPHRKVIAQKTEDTNLEEIKENNLKKTIILIFKEKMKEMIGKSQRTEIINHRTISKKVIRLIIKNIKKIKAHNLCKTTKNYQNEEIMITYLTIRIKIKK